MNPGGILVLVPTEMELARIDAAGGLPTAGVVSSVCGFGVVAAAARTAQLLSEMQPSRVLLLGIAGSLHPDLAPLGAAREFSSVTIDGIGAGEGSAFISAAEMGFPQWQREEPIFDRLALSPTSADCGSLLTVCAASFDDAHAARRRHRFPGSVAEDMEGFAVAMACALHRCPLRIVRGISNIAGDRDSKHWRISDALSAARSYALKVFEQDWNAHL